MTFKIGDHVIYLGEGENNSHKYKCVITHIGGNGITASFTGTKTYKNGESFGHHTFHKEMFRYAGPPPTIEDRVLEKSKLLWNLSNYVKKNPHLSY
jgi:hypothetical protein